MGGWYGIERVVGGWWCSHSGERCGDRGRSGWVVARRSQHIGSAPQSGLAHRVGRLRALSVSEGGGPQTSKRVARPTLRPSQVRVWLVTPRKMMGVHHNLSYILLLFVAVCASTSKVAFNKTCPTAPVSPSNSNTLWFVME